MPVFVTSTSQAKRHGVFAIERRPPSVVRAQGSSVVSIVEQFPWGPDQTPTQVTGTKDFIDKFAPAGSDHTTSGYLSVIGKSWPTLKVVRVLGTGVKATCTINKAGPVAMLTLTLKYKGVLGNSVTATTAVASDGDANHFNLTITLTGASGTTTDFIENLNYSGVGTDSVPDLTKTLLIGTIAKVAAGVPIIGTTSFATGTDGSITSAEYVGTQGASDKGVATLEGDRTVDFVFTGDPGNSLRAAVNAGLVAHADYKTDRMAFINGNSGLSLASVTTDVASYRSIRACYIDVWAYMLDDVDGTERITPAAPWAVSVASSLSPSTSFAWKSALVKSLLQKVTRLETQRGDSAGTNTDNGICTFIAEDLGGFTFEAAVNTNAPVNPAKRTYKRTRMGHYMAKAITSSLRESTDSPNVPLNQQDEINAVQVFLSELLRNRDTDPNNLPHLADAAIDDVATFNTQSQIDAGQFVIPVSAKISPDQEKIFISLNFGETVTVNSVL